MKNLILLCSILTVSSLFAQEKQLWVENKNVILQGVVSFESAPELFVGQEYFFTIIANQKNFDLEIQSENLTVTLVEESQKMTGGLSFKVTPIDTGDCYLQLSVGNNKKRGASLISKIFHASPYPMPPVFIAGIRSGEIIYDLPKDAGLSCGFDKSTGIFEGYSVLSWTAKLGDREFKGVGEMLSKELIDFVNKPTTNDRFLSFTVELNENNTGFRTSEGVFIVK